MIALRLPNPRPAAGARRAGRIGLSPRGKPGARRRAAAATAACAAPPDHRRRADAALFTASPAKRTKRFAASNS